MDKHDCIVCQVLRNKYPFLHDSSLERIYNEYSGTSDYQMIKLSMMFRALLWQVGEETGLNKAARWVLKRFWLTALIMFIPVALVAVGVYQEFIQ